MTRRPLPAQGGRGTAGGRRTISLGRLSGFPVLLDRSWFVIAVVIIVLYTPVLSRSVPQIGAWSYLVAAGFCLLLAASVLLHELAHAWAARGFGLPVTHIVLSLMGGHTTFGHDHGRMSWGASLVISVVGPTANLLLGGIGWAVLSTVGDTEQATGLQVLMVLVELTTWANLFVGAFNLIPGLPLDGGRGLEAVIWGISGREHVGTLVAAWVGRLIAATVVAGLLLTGLWRSLALLLVAVLLVWMLLSGASTALRRSRAVRAMSEVRARDLMEPAIAVSAQTPLATVEVLLREAFDAAPTTARATAREPGPVAVVALDDDGTPAGILNPARITGLSPEEQATTRLRRVMDPLTPQAVLSDELSEMGLLEFTAESRLGVFVVVDADTTPVGVLRAARLNDLLAQAGLLR